MMGTSSATAVATSSAFMAKQPSPQMATTTRSGLAICTPMAAPMLCPMLPSPVMAMNPSGTLVRRKWVAKRKCSPLSMVKMASGGNSDCSSVNATCGAISRGPSVSTWRLTPKVLRRCCGSSAIMRSRNSSAGATMPSWN